MLASRYNVFHTAACQPKQAAALASSNLYILISIDETNLLGRSNGMIDLNFVLKEETMSGTRTYDPKTRKNDKLGRKLSSTLMRSQRPTEGRKLKRSENDNWESLCQIFAFFF